MGDHCSVCDNRVRRPIVDAALDKGISAAGIARDMADTGWPVTAPTINRHRRHYVAAVPEAVGGRTKRDVAIIVHDRTVEWLDTPDDAGALPGPGSPFWKDGLGPGLAAVKIMDTRISKVDDRKTAFAIGVLMAGGSVAGFLAPTNERIDEGEVIDAEAEEVE